MSTAEDAQQPEDSSSWRVQSQSKLQETADALRQALQSNKKKDTMVSLPRLRPCQSLQESQGYRCRCSFQVVVVVAIGTHDKKFQLAIRRNGQPVAIDTYPMANFRIQESMKNFVNYLNTKNELQKNNDDPANNVMLITKGLTSVTFVTSWNPSLCCLVTLHYEEPLPEHWHTPARQLGTALQWQQVTGRSKGQVQRAFPVNKEMMLPDCLCLQRQPQGWKVWLQEDMQASSSIIRSSRPIIPVHYLKPESAFAHPNPQIMCEALAWILERMEGIVTNASSNNHPATKRRVVELYCGCGAHTMAILCSGLLYGDTDDEGTIPMMAVELDDRLIQACRQNARLNHCSDKIHIVSQDAGKWAQTASSTVSSILLVDPPRQGLDANVCRMAIQNHSIQDVLYISCGREALVRDLQILKQDFDVVECLLLDLFPQTHSVESLVHLQRIKR